jgi:predicted RNase H-like nuclease (RuvC/YqgF family)
LCSQAASYRDKLKALQNQADEEKAASEQLTETRLVQAQAQFAEEKSTLETVIQALEAENKALVDQVEEMREEIESLVAKLAELEKQVSTRAIDHAAVVQELEAKLEESQAANFDMQKSYQRQVSSLSVLSVIRPPCYYFISDPSIDGKGQGLGGPSQ